MVEPTIVNRAEHSLSRRDIDPDALKVLYRLHDHNFVAYLVGGSVRDLLLERRPKDFDIGTSAHPHQIKKLFRNCWIIGRRFRLAHVKFGLKTIEVATFRRQVDPSETVEAEIAEVTAGEAAGDETAIETADDDAGETDRSPAPAPRSATGHGRLPIAVKGGRPDHLIHRDNTYGTPEEDAFRRDFTVNALFYDIATLSIIDYTGGLEDLRAGVMRCIGDPEVRFLEDPVRMLRAVVLAARLQFTIDDPILDAIQVHKHEMARSAPARLVEEYYKILRSGHGKEAFRQLRDTGLLKAITPELGAAPEALWRAVGALDRYRARFEESPGTLTNAILAGTLLVPLGLIGRRPRFSADPLERRIELGLLPIARRDVERLQQIIAVQHRLLDVNASARAQKSLLHRSVFDEALTWLEIHGERPEVVAHWRAVQRDATGQRPQPEEPAARPFRRRRRRRRRPIMDSQ